MPMYQYQFQEHLLTETERKSILEFSHQNSRYFRRYISKITGNPDDNLSHIFTLEESALLFGRFLNSIKIKPRSTSVLVMPAFGKMPWHRDEDVDNRRTCIMYPLSPDIPNYARTEFYNSDTKGIIVSEYTNGYPIIANTQELHRIKNNSFERVNLQISFNENIEVILDLYLANQLF